SRSGPSRLSTEPDMTPILRAFLGRVVRHGGLAVERAAGARFTVGDGRGRPVAVRFADKAGERQLMLNPALALGELFMDDRLAVTQGSIYDVLELVAQNVKTMT